MAIRKVANAYYVVRDMDRSARFYRDVLGLEVKFADPGKWTQFDVAGTQIAIATPAPGQPDPGENATVVLEVDDLDAMQQRLRDEGMTPSEVIAMGSHGSFFTVRDPDGNLVQFFARAG